MFPSIYSLRPQEEKLKEVITETNQLQRTLRDNLRHAGMEGTHLPPPCLFFSPWIFYLGMVLFGALYPPFYLLPLHSNPFLGLNAGDPYCAANIVALTTAPGLCFEAEITPPCASTKGGA